MAKTIACSLNEVKDKDLMDYMDGMNKIGLNNAALIKVALYKIMGESMDSLLSIPTNNVLNKPSEEKPEEPENYDKTEVETEEQEIEVEEEEEIIVSQEEKAIEITNTNKFKTKLTQIDPKR